MSKHGADATFIEVNGVVTDGIIRRMKRICVSLTSEWKEHLEPTRTERRKAKAKRAAKRRKRSAARMRA